MVGIGLVMLAHGAGRACGCAGAGGLSDSDRVSARAANAGAPLGFLAVIAGWTTTEVGRQPWTVYGLLRTADSVTPSLTGTDVLISLAGYMVVYLIMFPGRPADDGAHRAPAVRARGPATGADRGRPAVAAVRALPRRAEAAP